MKCNLLGKGSYSNVYLFKDIVTGELLAGKEIDMKKVKCGRGEKNVWNEIMIHK